MREKHYEADDEHFNAPAYTVKGWRGIAFYVLGWETEPDEDTEWSGQERRSGRVVVQMVGDDGHHLCDEVDLAPLPREEYCGECGQVGCKGDLYGM